MFKRSGAVLLVLALAAIGVSAQGLDTRASKDDWEEINFEFNSSVLVDGFPSLLRLAELLQKNPGYKVRIEGHTDRIGSDRSNERLGLARANMVRDFLVKYGARPTQIDTSTRGKADPKYAGQKPTYSRTDEARWMNRRVVLTVTDDQGRTVSAAGVGDAIRAIEPPAPQAAGLTDCCTEVLRRLDKLDDIAKALKDLADQNAALQRQLDALRQNQQVIESKVNQPPPSVPTTNEVATAVANELNKNKVSPFQLLGVNAGADANGHVTFTGKGRFFEPFGSTYALQAQAEYLAFHGQKEGQFDIGLVDRILPRLQAGLFGSMKYVDISEYQNGGVLGQAAFTVDYIFKYGKLGLFGTKGFRNEANINSALVVLPNGVTSPDLTSETYLRIVDQVGISGSIGLWGNNYLEGNAGFLKSAMYGDRFGGTLRLVFPLNNKVAFTAEGGINPTIVGVGTTGMALFGLQFGSVLRPKEFLGTDHPVPVDVPRVRYDVLTRTVRVGHTPPVADAGPNQIGVPAGTITLNGSGSYSPDGLPITYQWTQQAGPPVTLASPTAVTTTFVAASAQAYTFLLTVKDSLGGQGTARVSITTTAANKPSIEAFLASPSQIQPGQSSTLSWNVTNATAVTITGLGNVSLAGSQSVQPAQTTTYTLTATNANGSSTATATVTVGTPQISLVYCYASPTNIIAGESATLYYQSQNATSVTIAPSVGNQGLGGTVVVTPTQSTTYTITATGAGGTTSSCNIGVTVAPGQLPRIVQFSAAPMSITAGQSSTLVWAVDNSTSVSISPAIGNVTAAGTQTVTPSATTVYTLTATNPTGSINAQATVTVTGAAPTITSFTATPATVTSGGASVLACAATNATSINIAGTAFTSSPATLTVHPTATTTYTCTASGATPPNATATVTVTVTGATGSGGPQIIFATGNLFVTTTRSFTLDASQSFSPAGNNPLTFVWTAVNNTAMIANPTSATPSVSLALNGGPADYLFQVVVTDSKGNSSTAMVVVEFIQSITNP
jgi:OmpA family protein/K319-like protein